MGSEVPPLVLLCGGKSERMGSLKGLLPFFGRTWLEEQIARFIAQGGREVIVGLGHFSERYVEVLPWLRGSAGLPRDLVEIAADEDPERNASSTIEIVVNEDPARGPFSTLWTAVTQVLRLEQVGALVLPIDAPLGPEVVELLMQDHAFAAVPEFGGRGGHPVRLSPEAVREVAREDPATQRLDHFLKALEARVSRRSASSDEVTLNLNSPETWAAYCRRSAEARPE